MSIMWQLPKKRRITDWIDLIDHLALLSFVIPKKAGIYRPLDNELDSRFRGNDNEVDWNPQGKRRTDDRYPFP